MVAERGESNPNKFDFITNEMRESELMSKGLLY